MAVESAKSIVDLIIQDSDLKLALVGIPHYFHTMIAFACSFLLKTATMYREHIKIDVNPIFEMIGQVVALCKSIQCAQYHLIHWIGEGLQIMLSNCVEAATNNEPGRGQTGAQQLGVNEPHLATSGTSPQNTEPDHAMGATQNLAGIWEVARQAATVYPTDNLAYHYDYPYATDRTMDVMDYANSGFGGGDLAGGPWDSSMTYRNMEHFGLGLGLL